MSRPSIVTRLHGKDVDVCRVWQRNLLEMRKARSQVKGRRRSRLWVCWMSDLESCVWQRLSRLVSM